MKYLLKQNKEDKGIFCDKVIIGIFDYYLDANDPNFRYVATNDPNIDLPKVVNEVEKISNELLSLSDLKSIDGTYKSYHYQAEAFLKGIKDGYNKSQETYPFSLDDMIEFAEWKGKEKFEWNIRYNNWTSQLIEYSGCLYTTKELFQLWKEQQPKIVYYNE